MTEPRTTFANGINPFQGLVALPFKTTTTDATMQKPAKPARNNAKRFKDEDYSTTYKPPMDMALPGGGDATRQHPQEVLPAPCLPTEAAPVPDAAVRTGKHTPMSARQILDPDSLQIVDDKLPAYRCAARFKYDAIFKKLKPGQAVRCLSSEVQKVSHALRKFVTAKKSPMLVRTVLEFEGDAGHGRVWMLAAGKVAA